MNKRQVAQFVRRAMELGGRKILIGSIGNIEEMLREEQRIEDERKKLVEKLNTEFQTVWDIVEP